MFFLKKIFQFRDHSNPSAEKPFLEHLEDLRICITRIVVTLLISTVACFVFRNELMAIIRRPVEQVWQRGQEKSLKDSEISLEAWEMAKGVESALVGIPPANRDIFLRDKAKEMEVELGELTENIEAVRYYRLALLFDKKKDRIAFLDNKDLEGVGDALRAKVLALIEGNPSAKVDSRGKMVLMQALKPTEGFMLSIKLAFFAGIVVAFPFLLFFLLQFVIPGMHDQERRALWPAMAVGFGLFLGGVFFAYFIVLPKVLEFFHSYSSGMMIENEWRIGYYISFATQFTLIFGLSFELPVLVMTLVHLGILNSEMMRNTRSYAILAIFVVAAIITPTPDAFTLCLLAGPMVILYEICIWLAYFLDRKKARKEAEEEKERMARLLALKERRATLGEDEDDHGDEHDGGDDDGDGPHGPDRGGPPDPGGPGDHDPYHDDPYHHHEHGEDHSAGHDHEPEDYDHEHGRPADHGPEHGDHDHPENFSYHDDEHRSDEETAPGGDRPSPPDLEQEDFDFHEESDPALTEEGEQEDISDPWPEEEDDEKDAGEDGPQEEDSGDDDIPDEERYRHRDDPHRRDQD